MSVVSILANRLLSLATYAQVAVTRTGVGPVVAAAAAAAALLYSWRQLARKLNAGRRQRPAVNTAPTSTTQERRHTELQQRQQRPKTLPGVRRVTIGAEATCFPAALFASNDSHTTHSTTPDVTEDLVSKQGEDVSESAVDATDEVQELIVDSSDDQVPDTNMHAQQANASATRRRLMIPQPVAMQLRRFAELFDLYVIARVDSDQAESDVRGALRAAGVFDAGLDERKVVFCDTTGGRVSVVRQLEPHLHIDETASVISSLQKFVKYVALVSPDARSLPAPAGANVLRYNSLAQFF